MATQKIKVQYIDTTGSTTGQVLTSAGSGNNAYWGSAASGGGSGNGYTGSAGVGYTGSAGAGYTGSAGAGYTGSAGTAGSIGYTGSAGEATSVTISPAFKGALVSTSTTQSLSAATWTILTILNNTVYDTNNFLSTANRFTIPAGITKVKLKGSVTGANQTDQWIVKINKNGSDTYASNSDIDSSGQDSSITVTPVMPVVQGDYFELLAYTQLARSTVVGPPYLWFSIEVIEGSILDTTSVIRTTGYTGSASTFVGYTGSAGVGYTGSAGTAGSVGYTGSAGAGYAGSAGTEALVYINTSAPASPTAGKLWYRSDQGRLYIYYNDGDSSQWVGVSASGGGSSGGSGGYIRTTITATAGQTSFSATYTVGSVLVFVNGVLLNTADYTATTGTTIVLAIAANLNDLVEIVAFGSSSSSTTYQVTYLMVAGGGSGGVNSSSGGGAGGLLQGITTLTPGTPYSFVIGAGGASVSSPTSGSLANGLPGSNTTAFSLTAIGGGYGNGGNGGSGGGGGGTGTSGQGNAGGSSGPAGGGGAGAAGGSFSGSWPNSGTGGAGGAGLITVIAGSSTYYAGGGGAAGDPRGVAAGAGGIGGGGSGASAAGAAGGSGTVNTGGGGGATAFGWGSNQGNSGAGGSGVVIIAIPASSYSGTTTGSPTVALLTTPSGVYRVLTFTASGSYTA